MLNQEAKSETTNESDDPANQGSLNEEVPPSNDETGEGSSSQIFNASTLSRELCGGLRELLVSLLVNPSKFGVRGTRAVLRGIHEQGYRGGFGRVRGDSPVGPGL
jgi:hypothetical protein